MVIGVPKEHNPEETRVALIPSTVEKLVDLGAQVLIQKGAGVVSRCTDEDYEKAGAGVVEARRARGDDDAFSRQSDLATSLSLRLAKVVFQGVFLERTPPSGLHRPHRHTACNRSVQLFFFASFPSLWTAFSERCPCTVVF